MRIVSIASSKRVAEEEFRYPSDVTLTYAVRLDDVLRDEPRIDVLKCDIDGHDCRAIQGGLATLARTRPVVFAEFNPGTLRSFSEIDPVGYLRLFVGLDYRMTVLLRHAEPAACGQDVDRVLALLEAAGLEQVDLMLTPQCGAISWGPARFDARGAASARGEGKAPLDGVLRRDRGRPEAR
jgi:hypothetical protein